MARPGGGDRRHVRRLHQPRRRHRRRAGVATSQHPRAQATTARTQAHIATGRVQVGPCACPRRSEPATGPPQAQRECAQSTPPRAVRRFVSSPRIRACAPSKGRCARSDARLQDRVRGLWRRALHPQDRQCTNDVLPEVPGPLLVPRTGEGARGGWALLDRMRNGTGEWEDAVRGVPQGHARGVQGDEGQAEGAGSQGGIAAVGGASGVALPHCEALRR